MAENSVDNVRRRKNVPQTEGLYGDGASDNVKTSRSNRDMSEDSEDDVRSEDTEEDSRSIVMEFLSWINKLVGVLVMLLLAYKYSQYLKLLHENQLWFSNIKDVEREISFRTESGLYYSYYKQIVEAPSIVQGVQDLMYDNVTEHPSTINILERMNIYQEVVLAALYRTLPMVQGWFEPIYFYIDTLFMLQGVKLSAMYMMTWLLSGTWVAGLLMSAFLVFNREDETRISSTIPLRENWSLPFFWLQIMLLTYYFKPNLSATKQRWCLVGLVLSTTLFSVTWQFNQFVLLLQAMALYGTQLLGLLPHHKIAYLYLIDIAALLITCLLQFGNTMILGGLLFSFVPAALVIMYIQNHYLPVCRSGLWTSISKVIFYVILCFVLMKLFNTNIKFALNQEADEHIYKFVLTKFGWSFPRDFDVNLYLCNGAFEFLPLDTFMRLTAKLVLPLYIVVHTVILAVISTDMFCVWRDARPEDPQSTVSPSLPERPELTYHSIQAVFYGILAVSTLRMKYFWTPYIFVLGSSGICDEACWTWILSFLKIHSKFVVHMIRHALLLFILAALLYVALPPAMKELDDLREFYDEDTVQLMEWIKSATPSAAAFTGSMQLLAGVKLCTGRHITNHPHYEDKTLRLKTKQLYQMYGHRLPEDVHDILTQYNTDYMILEDSICMSPRAGCRLTDLIDLDYGVIPRGGKALPGLVHTKIPLFCDEIRHGKSFYSKYFTLVFANKTFRVYKVL